MGYIKKVCYATPLGAVGVYFGAGLGKALSDHINLLYELAEKYPHLDEICGASVLGISGFAAAYYFVDMVVEGMVEGKQKRVKRKAEKRALEKIAEQEAEKVPKKS